MSATPAAQLAHPSWRWVVLGACAPLFVCSQFYRVANAVLAPHLQRDLGLTSEALGTLGAAFFYGFAATQVPLALLLDRLGARACMAALSLVGAAGAVVFATAQGRGSATAGEVLLGVGMAGNLVGSLKLIGQWFSRREFATVVGAFAAFGTTGNLLATTPLALLVVAVGWRHAFLGFAAITAALALAFLALAREPPAGAPRADPGEELRLPLAAMLRRLLASRDYWLISFAAFCRYGSFVAIQALWAGPYLVEVVGLSPLRAANLLLLLNAAFVVGAPLGGWLSDRLLSSRKKLVLAALAGTCAAELALAVAGERTTVPRVGAILVLLGVSSAFGQVIWAHIREVTPAAMTGMATAGVNFFNMLGAAVFLHGTGWLLDRWSVGGLRTEQGYRTAFVATAAILAVALALYWFTRESKREPRGGAASPREPSRRSVHEVPIR